MPSKALQEAAEVGGSLPALPPSAACGRPSEAALQQPTLTPGLLAHKPMLDSLCSAQYAPTVPDLHLALHAHALSHKCHVHASEDILSVYKLELLRKLRIPSQDGSVPAAQHDASRCHQDDYDYWAESQPGGEPSLAKEWTALLRWVGGRPLKDVSLLSRRTEAKEDGRPITVHEALFARSFEAGNIQLALTRVDADAAPAAASLAMQGAAGAAGTIELGAGGAAGLELSDAAGASDSFAEGASASAEPLAGGWRISAARVTVRPGWVPTDPLHTWHNTEPFTGEAAAPPPESAPVESAAGKPGAKLNRAASNFKAKN
mmetsp:Transcript_6393/g.16671  ORF Transcript_6393/g.16671 Transcript_6393/m.16671 type:complete len:318 (-) Transcript_6393:131-1084(-)